MYEKDDWYWFYCFTGKTLKGSRTANFVPRMMTFCIEAFFLIMNKKLKFTIGVMFVPTAVTAG